MLSCFQNFQWPFKQKDEIRHLAFVLCQHAYSQMMEILILEIVMKFSISLHSLYQNIQRQMHGNILVACSLLKITGLKKLFFADNFIIYIVIFS